MAVMLGVRCLQQLFKRQNWLKMVGDVSVVEQACGVEGIGCDIWGDEAVYLQNCLQVHKGAK